MLTVPMIIILILSILGILWAEAVFKVCSGGRWLRPGLGTCESAFFQLHTCMNLGILHILESKHHNKLNAETDVRLQLSSTKQT